MPNSRTHTLASSNSIENFACREVSTQVETFNKHWKTFQFRQSGTLITYDNQTDIAYIWAVVLHADTVYSNYLTSLLSFSYAVFFKQLEYYPHCILKLIRNIFLSIE